MESDHPRRAYVLTLTIGADSREELVGAVRQIGFLIASDQMTQGICAGYGSSYTYNLDVDESVTHDSYFAAVDAWLAARKGEGNGD